MRRKINGVPRLVNYAGRDYSITEGSEKPQHQGLLIGKYWIAMDRAFWRERPSPGLDVRIRIKSVIY